MATDSTLGLGIIGTGHIARNGHMRALAGLAEAEVLAAYDAVPGKAGQFCEEFGIPQATDSLDELLAHPGIDAVIVATPPYAHHDPTVAALQAGRHVLCEKPFSLSVAEAAHMVRVARESGRFLAVCSARTRYTVAARKAHEVIHGGALGRVYHVRTSQYRVRGRPGLDILRQSPWFLDRQLAGGGVMMDLGTYALDLMLWFLGNPSVQTVFAHMVQGIGAPPPPEVKQDVEDHIEVMFTCDNDATGYLEIAWASNVGQHASGTFILGTEAGLRMDPLTLLTPGPDGRKLIAKRLLEESDEDTSGPDNVTRGFVTAVRAGRQPDTPPEEALEVVRLTAAAYHSVVTGHSVDVADVRET